MCQYIKLLSNCENDILFQTLSKNLSYFSSDGPKQIKGRSLDHIMAVHPVGYQPRKKREKTSHATILINAEFVRIYF